jgi:hypothetical protein
VSIEQVLLCCVLGIVIVYPLWANWTTLKLAGVLRRELIRAAGAAFVISGLMLLLDAAGRWSELARDQGVPAANHSLSSPLALTGIALIVVGAAQSIVRSILMPSNTMAKALNFDTEPSPMEYDLPVPASEYPPETLSPDHLGRMLS